MLELLIILNETNSQLVCLHVVVREGACFLKFRYITEILMPSHLSDFGKEIIQICIKYKAMQNLRIAQ